MQNYSHPSFFDGSLAALLAKGPNFLILGPNPEQPIGTQVKSFKWNGVYTFSSDERIVETFKNSSRDAFPRSPGNGMAGRTTDFLDVCYLLGSSVVGNYPDSSTSKIGQIRLENECKNELSRLTEQTITPTGTILLDAWSPSAPHFANLLSACATLPPGQVHIFSSDHAEKSDLYCALEDEGIIVPHQESLEVAFEALSDAGCCTEGLGAASKHLIRIGNSYHDIDLPVWNQIRRSARPISVDLLRRPILSSDASRFHIFRTLVGATDGVIPWEAVRSGLRVIRDFEDNLARKVSEAISLQRPQPPILLSGQAATGKSIALASLALDIAEVGNVAVLHQSNRLVRPTVEDVDAFASWAELKGALSTLFIWDGSQPVSEYFRISQQLESRGRKVVIVGSVYPSDEVPDNALKAPAQLSARETKAFTSLIQKFSPETYRAVEPRDSSFLAFLHNFLPETEYELRTSLAGELKSAEQTMQRFANLQRSVGNSESALNSMQLALQNAGIFVEDLFPHIEEEIGAPNTPFLDRHPLNRVTTLVMVAGQFGLAVPIDLALRILGPTAFENIREALVSSDIIREIESGSGDFALTSRNSLEAGLITKEKISIDTEIQVYVAVIQSVRSSASIFGGTDEVSFLVSVLENIGPNSKRVDRYVSHYWKVIEALQGIRTYGQEPNPRLVLQESAFTREYAQWLQRSGSFERTDVIGALEDLVDVITDILSNNPGKGAQQLSLSVELAAVNGTLLYELKRMESEESFPQVKSQMDSVKKYLSIARQIDPNNLHAVDVLCWTTLTALRNDTVPSEERINWVSDALASINSIDREAVTASQSAKLDKREIEIREALGDGSTIEDLLNRLEANGDPSATYYLAQRDVDRRDFTSALDRLQKASLEAKADWRCTQLMVDLTWLALTGHKLLSGERIPIHLSHDDIELIARLSIRLEFEDFPSLYKLKFAQGIASFFSGDYSSANRLFSETSRLTKLHRRRIYTLYLQADEDGTPTVYNGRIEQIGPNTGKVWVPDLRTSVSFETRQFSGFNDLVEGGLLPSFNIGFKLSRGAIAEPPRIRRSR